MIDAVSPSPIMSLEALPAWMTQTPSAQDMAVFENSIQSTERVVDTTPIDAGKIADQPIQSDTYVYRQDATNSTDTIGTNNSARDYSTGSYANSDLFFTDSPVHSPSHALGEHLLKHFASLDAKYQDLFANEETLARMGHVGRAADSNSGSTSVRFGEGGNMAEVMENFQASVALQTQISVWSTQVNLLTSGVSKGAQGLQTLFRNSG